MRRPCIFCLLALLLALALSSGAPCRAETGGDLTDETALRADARKVFKGKVDPFVNKYCVKCHGSRAKAGINLQSALKNPNGESAALHWKKAAANVKVHDMPPEDASKFPSDEERRQFIDSVGKIKYLASRDPGPFVIRRLTKTEYANTLRDLYGVDQSSPTVSPRKSSARAFSTRFPPCSPNCSSASPTRWSSRSWHRKAKRLPPCRSVSSGNRPPKGSDLRKEARRVARSLARDAYRRPPSDAELDVLVDVYDLARDNELNHSAALGLMLKAVLVSPQFLFITPAGEPESKEKIVLLDDHQLASRLSYLLWSAPPDAELAALADQGKLHKPDVLKAQVQAAVEGRPVAGLVRWFRSAMVARERVGRAGVRSENLSPNDACPPHGDDGGSPPVL